MTDDNADYGESDNREGQRGRFSRVLQGLFDFFTRLRQAIGGAREPNYFRIVIRLLYVALAVAVLGVVAMVFVSAYNTMVSVANGTVDYEAIVKAFDFTTPWRATIASVAVAIVVILLVAAGIVSIATLFHDGQSTFDILFTVVAFMSACFSAFTSATGFYLITAQEQYDLLRNTILPGLFGVFVFTLSLALWIGGAELMKTSHWFPNSQGRLITLPFVLTEKFVKLFIILPIPGLVLFGVSTWTSVVGLGGVDAVRQHYEFELQRLQAECSQTVVFRRRDVGINDQLSVAIANVKRISAEERQGGLLTRQVGEGEVAKFIEGVSFWLDSVLEETRRMSRQMEATSPSERISKTTMEGNMSDLFREASRYDESLCAELVDRLHSQLNSDAYENYDRWKRKFEVDFEQARLFVASNKSTSPILDFLAQQIQPASFWSANPKPRLPNTPLGRTQSAAIDRYADSILESLSALVERLNQSVVPRTIPSYDDVRPEKGLLLIRTAIAEIWSGERTPDAVEVSNSEEKVRRLSRITPREAVAKHAATNSELWILAFCWDFAGYSLLFVYLLFPEAQYRTPPRRPAIKQEILTPDVPRIAP